jgi:hypothetical protein
LKSQIATSSLQYPTDQQVMQKTLALTSQENMAHLILTIRGMRVMLDADLAAIYGVGLKRLNEQVRRNRRRFPTDFAFQLRRNELAALRSQIVMSGSHGGKRKLPWAFSEHGAIMLASVLNSPVAITASVAVVRAFVRLREMAISHKEFAKKLDELEARVEGHDKSLQHVFTALRQIMAPPTRVIGFQLKPPPKKSEGPSASAPKPSPLNPRPLRL